MAAQTVKLDLPEDIYERAKRAAATSHRPLEQIIIDWIHPPADEQTEQLVDLDQFTDEALIEIARTRLSQDRIERLRQLLAAQRERPLTVEEQREAEQLVEQEDILTLGRARAIYLLKQRGALPNDLAQSLP